MLFGPEPKPIEIPEPTFKPGDRVRMIAVPGWSDHFVGQTAELADYPVTPVTDPKVPGRLWYQARIEGFLVPVLDTEIEGPLPKPPSALALGLCHR